MTESQPNPHTNFALLATQLRTGVGLVVKCCAYMSKIQYRIERNSWAAQHSDNLLSCRATENRQVSLHQKHRFQTLRLITRRRDAQPSPQIWPKTDKCFLQFTMNNAATILKRKIYNGTRSEPYWLWTASLSSSNP